jgi:inosose dehydratase
VATQSRAPLTAPGTVAGHLAWAGIDPAASMTQYADRIAAVHLKDVHLEMA